jgi:hypothetical protein
VHHLKNKQAEVDDTSEGAESGVGGALDEGSVEDDVSTGRIISTSLREYFFTSAKKFIISEGLQA